MNIEVAKKGRTITKAPKLYICFVDCQKEFDRVKHDKFIEVMMRAGLRVDRMQQ